MSKKDGVERKFISLSESSRQTGADKSTISKACRGKLKTAGGLKWRYAK